MNQNNKEKVKKAIIEAIQRTGSIAFQKSKSRCPVITGALSDSGKGEELEQGYSLEYKKEYASFVNRGVKPGVRNINGYYRKDGAYVKSHSYWHPGQRAQHFIDGPLNEEFRGQEFANNLDRSLRMNFRNVRKQ